MFHLIISLDKNLQSNDLLIVLSIFAMNWKPMYRFEIIHRWTRINESYRTIFDQFLVFHEISPFFLSHCTLTTILSSTRSANVPANFYKLNCVNCSRTKGKERNRRGHVSTNGNKEEYRVLLYRQLKRYLSTCTG